MFKAQVESILANRTFYNRTRIEYSNCGNALVIDLIFSSYSDKDARII